MPVPMLFRLTLDVRNVSGELKYEEEQKLKESTIYEWSEVSYVSICIRIPICISGQAIILHVHVHCIAGYYHD
jgi:hypothetical protein